MKKSTRREIAKDTLEILERGSYQNSHDETVHVSKIQKAAVNGTLLYNPEELKGLIEQPLPQPKEDLITSYAVNGLTTLDSVRQEAEQATDIVCLNFASARNPGGGFLKGSQAQEESIARATGLYPCQLKAEKYYRANRAAKSCLYTDNMIYAPKVPVLKDEAGAVLDQPVLTSIITAPAVNAGVIVRNEPRNIDQIEPVMRRRIDMVLAICKRHEHTALILGAWGCGVFKNDPEMIARLFADLLFGKYENQFNRVVFSIYSHDERYIRPFRKHFS